jgi:hypothetical protein
MNALEWRKQLLIAESDLNRAHLLCEWQLMSADFSALASRAKAISGMASAAGWLVAGLSSFRSQQPTSAAARPSWWQTILKGARVASFLWSEFRSQGDAAKTNSRSQG